MTTEMDVERLVRVLRSKMFVDWLRIVTPGQGWGDHDRLSKDFAFDFARDILREYEGDRDPLLDDLSVATHQALTVFKSVADKLMKQNPTWEQLPTVLTEDERAVFVAALQIDSCLHDRPRGGARLG